MGRHPASACTKFQTIFLRKDQQILGLNWKVAETVAIKSQGWCWSVA